MSLLEDPLQDNPKRSEINKIYNNNIEKLITKYINTDNKKEKRSYSQMIDTYLLFKYGPGSYTVQFRQLRNPSNNQIQQFLKPVLQDK